MRDTCFLHRLILTLKRSADPAFIILKWSSHSSKPLSLFIQSDFSVPQSLKTQMEEVNSCAQLNPHFRTVHVHLRHKNLAWQEGKMCAEVFAGVGMPSTGCWCVSEEYRSSKTQFNWFHLEPVLSNTSLSTVGSLFLLDEKKPACLKTRGLAEKLNAQVCKTQMHYSKDNIKLIKTHLCLKWKHNASQSFPISSCNILFLSFRSMSVSGAVFLPGLQVRLLTNHNSKQAMLGKYGICVTQRQNFWPPCWHPNSCRHGACLMWRNKK